MLIPKWHWRGDIGYQNSSSEKIPYRNFFNQRIYWQNKIFNDTTEIQRYKCKIYHRTE